MWDIHNIQLQIAIGVFFHFNLCQVPGCAYLEFGFPVINEMKIKNEIKIL